MFSFSSPVHSQGKCMPNHLHVIQETHLSEKDPKKGCSSTGGLDPFCQQRWWPVFAHPTVLAPVSHAAFQHLNFPTAGQFPCSIFDPPEMFPSEGKFFKCVNHACPSQSFYGNIFNLLLTKILASSQDISMV